MADSTRCIAEMRERLVQVIDRAYLRINAEYLLEDLDVVVAYAEAMLGPYHKITQEAKEWYAYFWNKYRDNLEQHVEEAEARQFAVRVEAWLNFIRRL